MTETTADPGIFAITCESDGKCRSVFHGRGGYRRAWQAAYDEGWRGDLSGVRHCPSCVAERQPVITLWLDGQALTGYIAEKAALPEDLTPQTVITGVRQSLGAREGELPAPPEPEPGIGDLDEKADGHMTKFLADHDAEDARTGADQTTTMPAAEEITTLIPAAGEGGEAR